MTHYDQVRDCFVLSGEKPQVWPDGTQKSTNNDFDWRKSLEGRHAPRPRVPPPPRLRRRPSHK